ncbi:MAG: hypothetical protein K0Q49_2040 [Haloplasmataceae bacterium]|jgi:hypothetical protein|nr:hypothetical protein [Haloplasmataceae bacterium]
MNYKKHLKYIIIIILFILSFITYRYIKVNKRYESDSQAIEANRKVTEVLHKVTFDQFTVYFYQPEDNPIFVDYVYADEEGYKVPSKTISKQAITEHQVIWHFQEKNGADLVVVSKCLWDPSPFTIKDSENSTFEEITFLYEGFENTYYIASIDDVDEYKIYINDEEIKEWDKI